MSDEADPVAENIARVRERIARAVERSGRSASEITLVAVSKTFPPEAIRAAYGAGMRHFGENRVQEFEPKRQALGGLDSTWHMVGHVQGNKARKVAELFNRVDSIDRFSTAEKLDTAIAEGAAGERLPVLIEVKLAGEETKSGVEEAALAHLVEDISQKCSDLDLRGLMAIPPYAEDPEQARPFFRRLRELRDHLRQKVGLELPVLSMGMSHDFEVAIEEGATEVRIGTAIFGSRQQIL
ncbi:MAG: YggS family pyridoxal phosphate-dependent enzyme [Candidatus Acidiferrales bacterium]